jgi:hypothetical protein
MRMPDGGPLGETFFEAKLLAIAGALFLNNPGGGCVEFVLTLATQRLPELVRRDIRYGYMPYIEAESVCIFDDGGCLPALQYAMPCRNWASKHVRTHLIWHEYRKDALYGRIPCDGMDFISAPRP